MDTRFSRGDQMIRLRELMQGEPSEPPLAPLIPALSALSTSSFAVIDLIGVDRAWDQLHPQETHDRIRTGRQTDETWLAVTPSPGFLEMGPV